MPEAKCQQKACNAYHKWNTTFNAEKIMYRLRDKCKM